MKFLKTYDEEKKEVLNDIGNATLNLERALFHEVFRNKKFTDAIKATIETALYVMKISEVNITTEHGKIVLSLISSVRKTMFSVKREIEELPVTQEEKKRIDNLAYDRETATEKSASSAMYALNSAAALFTGSHKYEIYDDGR